MDHFGLALSGGGFRGTLYHLGVVRFMRDAGLLANVSHITSVSGGSILGAHLALNWDRYCGSAREFDEVSSELIRYTQMDVRNRIVRRFPFTSTVNQMRRLLRLGGNRQLTRPGLLEAHYEKFLYGEIPLAELPVRPKLHILTTNLSEGCLCSFNRDGLLLQRRASGKRDRFERVNMGLATVPMAVAASSAFPGFFPPLELDGWDVGAVQGEFDRQAFTDGGVYDNLGLRMFRCIQQSWVRETTPLTRHDLLAPKEVMMALQTANQLPEGTPIRRLKEMLNKYGVVDFGINSSDDPATSAVIKGLWEIIRTEALSSEPSFQEIEIADAAAQSLYQYLKSTDREPEVTDRLLLNRHLIESALQQVIGKPCLRMSDNRFRSILVSDAGGKFKVASDGRAGGLIKTALRSTDILMDRVYQLELEAFENNVGLISCPIGAVIPMSRDPNALDPEIQRQAARIRTDMDRFSDLEVATLIQHGYCVARAAARRADCEVSSEVAKGRPWIPELASSPFGNTPDEEPTEKPKERRLDLKVARQLRNASRRRTWSTIFSLHDWPTYIWVPLILVMLLSIPYQFYLSNETSQHREMVLSAIASSSPLYRKLVELLDESPRDPPPPVEFKEMDTIPPANTDGFEIIADSRIYDLRGWSLKETQARALAYNRLRIRRLKTSTDPVFRTQARSVDPEFRFRCESESLNPVFYRSSLPEGDFLWELALDFNRIPVESDVDVMINATVPSDKLTHSRDAGSISFTIPTKTGVSQIWILMPTDLIYDDFEIVRYPIESPELVKFVAPDSRVELPIGSIVTFRLLNPEEDYRYECRWKWKN